MKLIVGLGNPGDKYQNTRHNLGFEVVNELIKKLDDGKLKIGVEDGNWKLDKKFKAEVIKLNELLLIKPQTFMNNSGEAVKAVTSYYKIPISDVIVIHDDLDLPLGKIKVRIGGSAGGHHGVESIIEALKDDKFIRIRLGIGATGFLEEKNHSFVERFVLETFTSTEKPKVKQMIKNAVKSIDIILGEGLEAAQNEYN